jgi:hypothetical protein|tara:strand:+ start:2161 stop:2529 length:369 start_codon:yes stop_codon:yes gene_type:complete
LNEKLAVVRVKELFSSSAVGSATKTAEVSLLFFEDASPFLSDASIVAHAAAHKTPLHGTAASNTAALAAFTQHASKDPSLDTTCSTTNKPNRGCFSKIKTDDKERRTAYSSARSEAALGFGG